MGSRSRSGVIAARFNPLWQAIKFPLELDTFKGSFIRAASGELGEMDAGALSQQAPRRRFSRRKPDGKRVLHHSEATILERRLHFEADRCAFSSLPIFWRRHSTRARQRAAQGPLNQLTKCQPQSVSPGPAGVEEAMQLGSYAQLETSAGVRGQFAKTNRVCALTSNKNRTFYPIRL